MLKYNFKKFFSEHSIHNDDWFSNAHFIINKSILTGTQKKVFDNDYKNEETINNFLKSLDKVKRQFEDTKEPQQFTPELFIPYKKEKFDMIYNKTIDLAIQERYYNFLTDRNCKLYKGENSISPITIVDKNNEVVGMLLPVRVDSNWLDDGIDYKEYINELEAENQLKKAKKELKKVV